MRRSPCLKIPRRSAEEARRRLLSLGLLDGSLKPRSDEGFVYLPLKKPVSLEEAASLGGEPCTGFFEERFEGPRSIGEVLREKLGDAAPRITSYSIVGDIAIISITPGIAGREALVGEAITRVQRNIKAVYGKIGTEGDYRVQRLIHLYGEKRTHTVYRENGLRFWVDIASMYVNPRLASEHLRIALAAGDGEKVLDMFSGFGGFPINIAAMRRVVAVAVDLNPAALEALRRSLSLNRLRGIVEAMQADSSILSRILRGGFTRIIMNLPHRSHEYLGEACSLASPQAWIHVYVVASRGEEAAGRVVESALREGCPEPSLKNTRRVLDYAPYKYIYAVDMQLGSKAMRTS